MHYTYARVSRSSRSRWCALRTTLLKGAKDTNVDRATEPMDLVGLGLVVLFYSLVLALGVYAARLNKADKDDVGNDDAGGLLLAGRGLGFAAGLATLVATQVGGAFVNGTAEEVYKQGILWCLAPIGYSLSITVNAFFFADRLREKRCVTLVDVLQVR